MNPPSNAPAIPIRIVTMNPPGSRPGMRNFAMTPTTRPNRIQARMPIYPPSLRVVELCNALARVESSAGHRNRSRMRLDDAALLGLPRFAELREAEGGARHHHVAHRDVKIVPRGQEIQGNSDEPRCHDVAA